MKTCSQCKLEQSENNFYKNKKTGLYPYCKCCARRKYAKPHYFKNKQKYIERSVKNSYTLRAEYYEYKSTLKCSNCKESRPWCLDLHHVDPSIKTISITQAIRNNNRELFESEIKKCIPLCRNCHADLHYQQRQLNKISSQ